MIEGDVGPKRRSVASRAIRGRKGTARRRVRGIIRLLPGRQMATGIPAVIRLNRQRRVIPHVALIAARHLSGRRDLVRVRQRKTGVGVVERRIRPHDSVVTLRAERRRKARGNVVRYNSAKRWRAVPRRLVASKAIGVGHRERIVVAHVAVRAGIDFACG